MAGALAQLRAAATLERAAADGSNISDTVRDAAEREYRLADRWWPEASNAVRLGRLALEAGRSGSAPNRRTIDTAAERQFTHSLTEAPASAEGWFWLAEARFTVEGASQAAINALSMSISVARFDPALLAWRCQLGLALYRALEQPEREQLAVQIRLLGQVSMESLARVARVSKMMPVVVAALSDDPTTLKRLAIRLHYLK